MWKIAPSECKIVMDTWAVTSNSTNHQVCAQPSFSRAVDNESVRHLVSAVKEKAIPRGAIFRYPRSTECPARHVSAACLELFTTMHVRSIWRCQLKETMTSKNQRLNTRVRTRLWVSWQVVTTLHQDVCFTCEGGQCHCNALGALP